jgi:hypothetical protein
MHLEAVIERVWRCTWRPSSSELRDAVGGRDQVELRDALGGCDRASWEMHLEAMVGRDWRSTWRWSIWRLLIGREV